MSKQEALAAEELRHCLYSAAEKQEREHKYHKHKLTKEQRHKLARQVIGSHRNEAMAAGKLRLE